MYWPKGDSMAKPKADPFAALRDDNQKATAKANRGF